MTRHLLHLIGFALCILLPAAQVCAAGMGEITPHSKLFQPLSATIPLLRVAPGEHDQITVKLASPQEFKQAGLNWLPLYRSITPHIAIGGDKKPSIQLSSQVAMHEPILQLLLKLTTPEKTVLKTHTIFLDPPTPQQGILNSGGQSAIAQRKENSAPRPSPSIAQSDTTADNAPDSPREQLIKKGLLQGNIYGPVRDGDRISLIAQRTRQNSKISLNQLMLSILKANPDAFEQGNLNKLKRGVMLKLPAEQEALGIDKKQAAQLVLNHSLKGQPATSSHQPSSAHAETSTKKPPHHRDMASGQRSILQITEAPDPKPPAKPAAAKSPPSAQPLNAYTVPGTNDPGVQAALNSLQEQFEKTKQILILQTDLIEAAERTKQARARANLNLKRELEQQSRRLHTLEQQLQNLKTPPTAEQFIDAAWERYGLYIWGLLALLLLLAIGLAWQLMRRSRSTPAQQPTQRTKSPTTLPKTAKSPRSHLVMADNSIDLEFSGEADASITSRPTSPANEETASPGQMNTPKAGKSSQIGDINLKEIEVRLSYGRFEQCVEMLERAIARQPDSPELMLKMLETHARASNDNAFAACAAKYRPLLSEDNWKAVISMAKSMGLDESKLSSAAASL